MNLQKKASKENDGDLYARYNLPKPEETGLIKMWLNTVEGYQRDLLLNVEKEKKRHDHIQLLGACMNKIPDQVNDHIHNLFSDIEQSK